MTIEAKMIRDTETRTVDTMLDAESGECKTRIETKRIVRLSLEGAPVMVSGRSGSYRYRPELLRLRFSDGALSRVDTWGYGIRKDGTKGKLAVEDEFSPNGSRLYYRDRADCPAEIMEIVRRFAA